MLRILRDKRNQQVLAGSGGWLLRQRDFGPLLSISLLLGNLPKRKSRRLPASKQTVAALPLAAMRLPRRSREVL
jgi:hypothetical protein